jgi:tetratricopeptide (TPR) repeat protein
MSSSEEGEKMAETLKPSKSIEVFFSYSHKDEELRNELSNHLATLRRQHVITEWHDRKIGAGKEWQGQIDQHLNTADIVLFLVSSDFLASDYCYDIEISTAMKRHEAGEATVIPVILRPVDWKGAPFAKLQALPKDAKPVTEWSNRDQAFLNVSQGIRAAIEELLISQINHLFTKLDKAESLGNWPNAINLGERILKLLPDHESTRLRTAAAYVKRWARCLVKESFDGYIDFHTKRHEDPIEVVAQVWADVNRAIQLEPKNAEYYYIRFSLVRSMTVGTVAFDRLVARLSLGDYERAMKASRTDLERAIDLDPSVAKYYYARANDRYSRLWRRSRDLKGAMSDLERASELGYPNTNWVEFLKRRISEEERSER